MPAKPNKPVIPIPSVALIVLRDGGMGLEVLMVERHKDLSFAAGALVFPGGKIDPEDRELAIEYKQPDGLEERARRLAGVRELFEETGLLLTDTSSDHARLQEDYRSPIDKGEITLMEMAEKEVLAFDLAGFQPFAHWITPVVAPRRFDTWFYLVPAPYGQTASADGSEATNLVWRNPGQIVEQGLCGDFRLMFPTRVNLQKLAESASVAEAIDQARASCIHTVTPDVRFKDGKKTLHIPPDAGYGEIASTDRESDTR